MHETISEPFVVPRFLNTTLRRRREYINSSQYNGQEVSNRLERNCLNRLQMGKFECFRYRAGTLHLFILFALRFYSHVTYAAAAAAAMLRTGFTLLPALRLRCARIKTTKQDCNFKSLKLGSRNHLVTEVLIKSVQAIRLLRLDSSATASSFVVVFAMATDYEW